MKRSKKIISFTMALLLICSILSGCKKDTMPSQDETINVITMSSYEDLKQVDTNALNGRLTVYKVGEMYYAYFPSTNTIEAITAPRAYDYQTAEVIDNLYMNTFIKDGEEYVISERTVETIEVFGDAVESRIQYISKELDNCSASLVVEDNADIAEYKEQLLSEMEKLIIYQSEISKELKEILIHLDPETQAELAQRISILMDKTFVDSINQYTYAETNNFNTEKTIEALKEIISSQEVVIKELSEKYAELEKVLVNKRVYFEQVSDIIDSPEFQEVIKSLDTYVNNYVNDCSEEFDRLNTKISALESLYETVKNTDSEKYEDVLTALRTEYQNIIEQQRDLQEQTAYLRDLTGQAVENSESASDINAIISEELEKQQEQLDLLDEIISSSNLKDIDDLAMQQDYLYEYIRQLETVQKTLETTVTKEQYEEIKEIRTQLEQISLSGTDADQLRAYITVLQKDMKNLDEETQKALEELSELLKNTAAGDINELTKQLNDTIASLDSTIAEQDAQIAEQEKALAALIKSTTDQLQADIMYTLENSISEQEENLKNEKIALEALISSSGEDLKTELTGVIDTLDAETQAEIDKILSMTEDSSKTEELEAAINALRTDLETDIAAQETTIADNKTALETMVNAKTAQVKTELEALMTTADTETQEKIKSVLDKLDANNTSQTEALNNAVTDLQTALNNSVMDSETKLANEKAALEALISSSGADMKSELTTVINTLDTDTQAEIQEVIDLLNNKDTAQTNALNTAISSLEQTLNDDIAETEAKIATEKATLSSLITSSNSELETELKALISTTDTNLQAKITAVLDELDENEAAQTEALDNAVSELQTLLNTKVSATETKLANEKAALTALISSSDADMKSELTAIINTLDTDTQADIQEVIDLLDSKDTAQTAARTTAISNLEQTLNDDIAATEAKLASEKSALSTLITNKTSELRTDFEAELSTVSGDLTALSGDLGDLSEAYNKFISEDYADYMSETDGAINTLDSAIDTLNSDYAAYKTATGNSITDIENLLDVLETDGNNTETALNNFKTSTNTELSSIKTKVNTEVSNLNTLITDNYNEAQSDISALSAEVTDLKTILNGHTTSLNDITARVSELETNLTVLETTVNELSDKIDNLINNPYELPPATSSILGGVKVDGSTIAVDPDGTLHVLVGYNTLDEFYDVGTIYDTEDDIRDRIKPYCTQAYQTDEIRTTTKTVNTTAYKSVKTYKYYKNESHSTTCTSGCSCYNGCRKNYGLVSTTEITETYYNENKSKAGWSGSTYPNYPQYQCTCGHWPTLDVTYNWEQVADTYNYGYVYKNPYTNEIDTIILGTETAANIDSVIIPTTVDVSGEELVTVCKTTLLLNDIQLQKLYDKGIISNVIDPDVYNQEIYDKIGIIKWMYCGIPTIPTTSI